MQEQHINQPMHTFYIPNVPGTVQQPNNQPILISSGTNNVQQSNFIQSVRMPINQWTAPNMTGPRIIPTHSFVLTQPPLKQQPSNFMPSTLASFTSPTAPQQQSTQNIRQTSTALASSTHYPSPAMKFNVIPSPTSLNTTNTNPLHHITPANILKTNDPSSTSCNNNLPNPSSGLQDLSSSNNKVVYGNSNCSINTRRVMELLHSIDPLLQMDEDVQDMIVNFLEEFLLHVTTKAVDLSRLRNSPTVEVKDFQYIFEHDWNIYVPGYPSNDRAKKSYELDIHKMRMALIQRQCKK